MRGLTRKRYTGAVFALLLFLFLCGALSIPAEALAKVDPNNNAVWTNAIETMPTLSVSCCDTRVAAQSGKKVDIPLTSKGFYNMDDSKLYSNIKACAVAVSAAD